MPRRGARRRHAEPEAGRMQVDLDAVQSSLFRSEEMALVQLYIPSEVAQLTVSALGEMGVVHFRDLNSDLGAFQRAFVNEVRRLDEIERKIRFLSSQIEKENIQIRPTTTLRVSRTSGARTAREIDELEEQLSLHENRVLQMNTGMETLKSRYLELTELGHVLRETARFFEAAYDREEDIRHSTEDLRDPLLRRDLEANAVDYGRRSGTITIGFVAGTIPRARMASFERILWRALRGNLYMNSAEIEDPIVDPHTDDASEKNVFIIFAHGTELLAKIRKISDSLGGTLYAIDADADRRREMALEVSSRIEDLTNVLQNTKKARHHELARVSTRVTDWSTIIKKEKAIYHAMNLFNYDPNRKCLIAEAWCPCAAIGPVQQTMRQVIDRCGANVPSILHELRTAKEPPTYHRTNKVTKGFQGIIDAYGVAQYREVNPGLFTVITFPFFFAVMFGDLGHGFMVTMFALWMVMNERRLAAQENHEIFSMFFGGRYIILVMGVFSMFTGLIYNDVFSRAFFLAETGWVFDRTQVSETVTAARVAGYTYPFGLDPAWHLAENALLFTNSYKMKMSIIFGVLHMSFAICLQVYNHIHFRHPSNVWAEFVPQIIFMTSIFGYLAICVVAKWCMDWSTAQPPSLLNMLIDMFLSPGTIREPLYPGQAAVQVILLLVAVVCVPWMLFTKPILELREHKAILNAGYSGIVDFELQQPASRARSRESSVASESTARIEMAHEEVVRAPELFWTAIEFRLAAK